MIERLRASQGRKPVVHPGLVNPDGQVCARHGSGRDRRVHEKSKRRSTGVPILLARRLREEAPRPPDETRPRASVGVNIIDKDKKCEKTKLLANSQSIENKTQSKGKSQDG
jgi:hypothetical protein